MSREKKFKVWDKVGKCFVEPNTASFCILYRDGKVVLLEGEMSCFTFVEYTGLKDANGVEIYEGDIVKIQHYHDKRKYINGEVKFLDGSFIVDVIDMESLLSCERDSIKVVGNIYENPELLEAV